MKSLQAEYGDRVDFVEVDYETDPSALSKYDVSKDDFTVLLLKWRTETGDYGEYARFVGNVKAGTFDLAAIQSGLQALLDSEGA